MRVFDYYSRTWKIVTDVTKLSTATPSTLTTIYEFPMRATVWCGSKHPVVARRSTRSMTMVNSTASEARSMEPRGRMTSVATILMACWLAWKSLRAWWAHWTHWTVGAGRSESTFPETSMST